MIIRKISHFLCDYRNIMPLFAGACALIFLAGILLLPIPYAEHQLYPKYIDRNSTLDPYDRGGPPFFQATIGSHTLRIPRLPGLSRPTSPPSRSSLHRQPGTLARPSLHTPGAFLTRSCTTPAGWIRWLNQRSCSSRLRSLHTSTGRDSHVGTVQLRDSRRDGRGNHRVLCPCAGIR